jgi:hypothetical protein
MEMADPFDRKPGNVEQYNDFLEGPLDEVWGIVARHAARGPT